jgi:hypothetical protein
MEELFTKDELEQIESFYNDKNDRFLMNLIRRKVNIRPPVPLIMFLKNFDYERPFNDFMEELNTINTIYNKK